eukprot:COSAG05_NODE_1782_length_4096_cov_18.941206_4_plen_100_part_00
MHGYKWPINCTRTRRLATQTEMQQLRQMYEEESRQREAAQATLAAMAAQVTTMLANQVRAPSPLIYSGCPGHTCRASECKILDCARTHIIPYIHTTRIA